MEQQIIGRETEKNLLNDCYESGKAELVAVYGRRRIGKTFLVKSMFQEKFDFFVTGIYEGKAKDELAIWNKKLNEHSHSNYKKPRSWDEAFDQLKHYILSLDKRRVVVFIDEMPWLDTPKSNFVRAFEFFWNDWASTQNNLMMIVCGSATTWMNDNVISQKGGLHNRVTRKIKLSQFNLHETSLFLQSRNIRWTNHQIAECYMIFGGTPYYLDLLQKGKSLAQNVDFLFFRNGAELADEYDTLLKSLFRNAQAYRIIIEQLAKRGLGMTRKELSDSTSLPAGGSMTELLDNLQNCDFIRSYSAFGKKERDTMYQLCDMFILFYLRFVKNQGGVDESFWTNSVDNPARRAWSGYAFEQLCFSHIPQIKDRLGIRGVLSNVCSWYRKADKEKGLKGHQIDMLIERRDQVVNVCEAKFSLKPYIITEMYLEEMYERMEDFRDTVKSNAALHLTVIASAGVAPNEYAESVQSIITLEDLFKW